MKILTVAEVKEQTGWSSRVVWGMFNRGDVQGQLVGRNWITTQAALNAYNNKRRYTLKTFYSAQTAADYLGVDHWKIRRLVRDKLLTPVAMIGRKGETGTAIFSQRQLDNMDQALLNRRGGIPADTTYDKYLVQENGRWIVVGTRNIGGVPYSGTYLRNVKPIARRAYSAPPLQQKGARVKAATDGRRKDATGIFTLAEDLRAGSLTVLIEDSEGQFVASVRRLYFLDY